ncbi:hypothetical protein IRJ41_023986 [Triplophysa rosa]|uniref:HAT C-terminal dimerisation domain-containing protein n=1 Tax=Triplophysa rosa TaxID=992332 RepID=A0A9W7TRQ3_TRIRA|nr:hypothetical protein IRJ41_023986 [Triplophysa rosa]
MRNKEKLQGKNLSLQCTIASTVASSDVRREFVEDFVAVCAEADIPYEKMKKLRPFLIKHCKQGGSLPQNESSLRQTHLPRVFEQHMEAVLNKISGKKMWVVVDETTDIRDCSVLNIVIAVNTRWNSWFEAVKYHAEHVHIYKEFLLAENLSSQAVTNILNLVETEEKVQDLTVKMSFVSEGCSKLITALSILEGTHRPTAVSAYNVMEELGSYLANGTAKTCGFGPKTDALLRQMSINERREVLDHLHDAFHLAFTKFSKHWDTHSAKEIYKLVRVFDPRQAAAMEKQIEAYAQLKPLANPSAELTEEWIAYQYCVSREAISPSVELGDYWKGMSERFPRIAEIAVPYIYFPMSSINSERSFSKYKTLLTDKREALTELNTKRLAIMYFNGDVSDKWKT